MLIDFRLNVLILTWHHCREHVIHISADRHVIHVSDPGNKFPLYARFPIVAFPISICIIFISKLKGAYLRTCYLNPNLQNQTNIEFLTSTSIVLGDY